MSVRSRRLALAAVIAATAIAVPTAALASGSPGKSAPSAAATKPAAASKSAASKSGAAGGSAAAIKSAARQSAAPSSIAAMVAALATRLGVSHSAAQHALNQVQALVREGIDPASPAFAAIAHGLGVSPAQLSDALRAAKQSLGGR